VCAEEPGSEKEAVLCVCEAEIVTGRRREPDGDAMIGRTLSARRNGLGGVPTLALAKAFGSYILFV
jgi:hypothetical protein